MTNGAKEWKLDVKGMDVVRSNFPKAFREFMSGVLIDILNISEKKKIDDKVLAFINVLNLKDEEYINSHHIVMCTKKGVIKKTSLEAYSRPRVNGINAITIRV